MRNLFIVGSIIAAFFITPMTASAGDWSDDQKAVWATVEVFWEAEKNKDQDIWDALLTDDLKSWSNALAMPRSKSSTIGWFHFGFESGKTLKYELTPVDIVVNGDAAIAHYYYVTVTEDKDGKRDSDNGRWSDVLVRDGDKWRFIGWQGGSDKDDD